MEQRKVWGYTRVSMQSQVEKTSLAAQEDKIKNWCLLNGYELAGVMCDKGISGKRADNRPALQEALNAVTKEKGILCVYSLSRLARSTRDAIAISERLQAASADLCSLSEQLDSSTPSGRMIFGIFATLSQFEREQLVSRVKSSLTLRKSRNLRTGRIPFGMDCFDGENLTENRAEQAVIADMLEMDAKGMSLRKIVKALTEKGIKAKGGREWQPSSVMVVVKSNKLKVAA